MTDRPRRRQHPAALSRRAATTLSSALSLGLVAAMGWSSAGSVEAAAVAPAEVEGTAAPVPPPPRRIRVVVRRHHAAPAAAPEPIIVRRPAAPSAPQPAPAPVTRSGGS